MIRFDEKKLRENGPRKPVPYMDTRGTEELEFRLPSNTAYHLTERNPSNLPNDQRADR